MSFRWNSDDWGILGDGLLVCAVFSALVLAMYLWAT